MKGETPAPVFRWHDYRPAPAVGHSIEGLPALRYRVSRLEHRVAEFERVVRLGRDITGKFKRSSSP